ncbi:MAG: molybdate ABC transporter substrate-binding protein [Rhodospirillales bacterium]
MIFGLALPRRPLLLCASLALVLSLLLPASTARAGEALIAVAANVKPAVDRLRAAFEAESGHVLTVSVGSTGKLFAQIVNGAPFTILLAADQDRPARLEAEGWAVPGSRFTYATGRLALWSPDPGAIPGGDGPAVLSAGGFRALAIANPALAPYGLAATETLEALGLAQELADRLVIGQNIGQAFALVATGNAELGFIARSLLPAFDAPLAGSRWLVPADLHAPIRQDAVLLRAGADNPAALAFLHFLRGAEAAAILETQGYGAD